MVAFNGPLLPAKPGPTLNGTRIVWALMLADSPLLLLLLSSLLLSSLLLVPPWLRLLERSGLVALLFALALARALRLWPDHTPLAAEVQQ